MKIRVCGVLLLNKPLSNIELIDAVKNLRISNFRGVFVRDRLPHRAQTRECGIVNLDDSSGNGTHWVSWYRKNNKHFYFDSYGIQPPREIINYISSPILYNTERIQSSGAVGPYFAVICVYTY